MDLPLGFLSIAALGVVLYLYFHKRSTKPTSPLLSVGTAHTTLNPTGSVFIDGELWLARSNDGKIIPERAKITVVGLSDHHLLVCPYRKHPSKKLEHNLTTSN